MTSLIEKLLRIGDPKYLQPSGETESKSEPVNVNEGIWCDIHKTYHSGHLNMMQPKLKSASTMQQQEQQSSIISGDKLEKLLRISDVKMLGLP
jgi:hypothetical protein